MTGAATSLPVVVPGGPRLRVLRWGDPAAPPLLLIHGAGAHAHWWAEIAPALGATHLVIAPDLRGHGGSDRAASYLIEDFAADCVAVLDAQARGPIGVVGHSMGGRVATWIAAHHPRRVRALALLDARLGAVPAARAARWRGARAADAPRRTYATRAEAMRAFRVTPAEPGVDAAVLDALATHAVTALPEGRWALALDRAVLALDGSRIADLLPLLAGVRCPTLVLRGRDSTVIGAAQEAALRAVLPHAVQETVDGGHHFLLAHPDAVATRLVAFLA